MKFFVSLVTITSLAVILCSRLPLSAKPVVPQNKAFEVLLEDSDLISNRNIYKVRSTQIAELSSKYLGNWKGQLFLDNTAAEPSCPQAAALEITVLPEKDKKCRESSCKIVGNYKLNFYPHREVTGSIQGEIDHLGNYWFETTNSEINGYSYGALGDNAVTASYSDSTDCFSHYSLVKLVG